MHVSLTGCVVPSMWEHLRRVAPAVEPALHGLKEPAFATRPGSHRKVVAFSLRRFATLVGDLDLCAIAPETGRCVYARRLAHVAGRLCAELALFELGCGNTGVGRGEAGEPLWPIGCVGSIAHSSDLAIAMAARTHFVSALGVDVERVVDSPTRCAIESICLTKSEVAWSAVVGRSDAVASTLLFSAKEAYYKAVYPRVGRCVDYPEAEVHDVDWQSRTFVVRPVEGGTASDLPIVNGFFSLHDGMVTTWCEERVGQ